MLKPTENSEHCTESSGTTEILRKLVQLSHLVPSDYIFLPVFVVPVLHLFFFLVGLHLLVTQSCLVVSVKGQGTLKHGFAFAKLVGQ